MINENLPNSDSHRKSVLVNIMKYMDILCKQKLTVELYCNDISILQIEKTWWFIWYDSQILRIYHAEERGRTILLCDVQVVKHVRLIWVCWFNNLLAKLRRKVVGVHETPVSACVNCVKCSLRRMVMTNMCRHFTNEGYCFHKLVFNKGIHSSLCSIS